LDDDDGPLRRKRISWARRGGPGVARNAAVTLLVIAAVCGLSLAVTVRIQDAGAEAGSLAGAAVSQPALLAAAAGEGGAGHVAYARPWRDFLPPSVLLVVFVLLTLSAFFSSSETAFLSIARPRLRIMRGERRVTSRLVVRMLDNPGRLLTTILVGNMLVNTIIGVVLGTRVKNLFEYALDLPTAAAYIAAVVVCTSALLFFGEITPKVFAVRARESYARFAVFPLLVADRILAPLRESSLRLTDFLFHVTRFHELRAAPFITDEELKSVLSDEQTNGVIEEEGREMIRRILDFGDVTVGKIVVPRPDVVALAQDATVGQALILFREHEFSRMPVFSEDLDHIEGIVFAKDLLPSVSKGALDEPIRPLARPAYFVPETMSVQAFVNEAQRLRSHLAVVVDEFGGTEGIVTLQDAFEEVVGDMQDEGDQEALPYEQLAEGVYRVEGSLPLDELKELIGIAVQEGEHNTVGGFLMEQTDKVPSLGDRISHSGMTWTVEEVDGKRVSKVRIEIAPKGEEPAQ